MGRAEHMMVIKKDRTLWGWGNNGYGQLGTGSTISNPSKTKIMDDVAYVSISSQNTLAIKTSGELFGWGGNNKGQLGIVAASVKSPVKIMDNVLKAVAGEQEFVCVLRKDGSLWSSGNNASGQLGDSTQTNRARFQKIMDDVVDVSCGYRHTLALKKNGDLFVFGGNLHFSLGTGGGVDMPTPTYLMSGVKKVATGDFTSFAITRENELYGWGDGSEGQLSGANAPYTSPKRMATDVVDVACGSTHTLYVKKDGSLWSVGTNSERERGLTPFSDWSNKTKVMKTMDGVKQIFCGAMYSAVIDNSGHLWFFGRNSTGASGIGHTQTLTSNVVTMSTEAFLLPNQTFVEPFLKYLVSSGGKIFSYRNMLWEEVEV